MRKFQGLLFVLKQSHIWHYIIRMTVPLMFCMLKKKKYILLTFQKLAQIVKNKLFF